MPMRVVFLFLADTKFPRNFLLSRLYFLASNHHASCSVERTRLSICSGVEAVEASSTRNSTASSVRQMQLGRHAAAL
jgi:hypothetical protein